MTLFSRAVTGVVAGLALLVLSACAAQTQTVPPASDVEFPAPTKDIWQASGDGDTALGAAAFLGRAEMAKILIRAGIDTSIRNDSGQSALDIARLD